MDVKLFANLADIAGTRITTVSADEGATVFEVLEAVFEEHPDLTDEVITEDGDLRDHINILVDGSNVRHEPKGLETTVDPETEIAIFPPVSGG